MRRIAVTLALLVASISFTAAAEARPPTKHRPRADTGSTQPDQVIQWNRTLVQILQTPGAQPATVHPTRSIAITQLAVYDAVNAIDGGSTPYLPQPHAPHAASPAAAAAAAAHRVLLSLFPTQQALIDAKFQDSLSQIGGGEHVRQGIGVGEQADNDGNPDTTGEANWTPLATTALDPSYAGAHAEISQSAAVALRDFFGTDRLDFSLTTPSLPSVVRSFQSFSQAADEASVSRIYAGQHFRYDEDAGQALGDEVGDFVLDSILGPTAHGHGLGNAA
jgi:hypothetical protein